jgi:hypothetical protein
MKHIGKAKDVLEREFEMLTWQDGLRDGRKRPQIPAGVTAQAAIEMVLRGQKSLLRVDQEMRLPEMLSHYESDREMVVSDSTLERSYSTLPVGPIRDMLIRTARVALARGRAAWKLPSGRSIRLGIVDGSQWGDDQGSVMLVAGEKTDTVAGYEMSPGRGHELAVSRKLRDFVFHKLGTGCVDLLTWDALYMNEEDLKWCVEKGGCHGLVKTKEERLEVIQDAKGIFSNPELFKDDIETQVGIDTRRGIRYRIQAVKNIPWRGMSLKVAHVVETALKPRKGRPAETDFYIITTDESLSGEDMREIAKARWNIENRAFRRLNQLVNSKRRLTKDVHVREVLLGLWFIGLNILGLLWSWMRPEGWPEKLRTVKKTWLWLERLFEREVVLVWKGTT